MKNLLKKVTVKINLWIEITLIIVLKTTGTLDRFFSPHHMRIDRILEKPKRFGQISNQSPKITISTFTIIDSKFNAAYNNNGNIISETALLRNLPLQKYNAPNNLENRKTQKHYNRAIYGGILFSRHYGHFLTETLSRLWPLVDSDFKSKHLETPILFRVAKQDKFSKKIKSHFAVQCFDALGILNQVEIIEERVSVYELIIPSPSNINNYKTFSVYCNLLRHLGLKLVEKIKPSKTTYPQKIYLSRNKLPANTRKIVNESLLERELKKLGFTIINPERLSMGEQIMHFTNAKCIIGSIGSAFHTIPLAVECNSDTKIIYLVHYDPRLPTTFNNIDKVLNLDTHAIRCLYKFPLTLKRASFKNQIADIKSIIETIKTTI